MNDQALQEHKTWPASLRWFHWINFTCIVGLFSMGMIMLNSSSLGISGYDAKIGLKVVHVLIGYVFVANLLIRTVLGFVGPANMRWSKVFPGRGIGGELKRFKAAKAAGRGHVAAQVAAEGVDPASLVPYDKTGMDEEASKALKEFKGPYGKVHIYSSYTLVALIFLHIFSVVWVEVRNRGSLISSIFSGRKIFSGPPGDQ
jgi:Ni,Fe-hydrogenase I cytochrome b subunit